MIDIKAIRAAAAAATPGPWVHGSDGRKELNNVSHFIEDCVPKWDRWLKEHLPALIVYGVNRAEDAAHIAKANPATVLAMCDEIERLRLPDDWYPESKDWRESPGDRGLWLRTMYEQAKEEIERLQKDAARYQFLRESNRITGKGLGASVKSDWLWHYDFEALDAAIDAAMEAKT